MQIIEHVPPPVTPLPCDPLSHPTRDDRRVDLEGQITLRCPDQEGPVTEHTQNVSATGLFIRTRSLLPPGTILQFSLDLANGLEPIQGQAEVMWARRRDAGLFRPAGMGLRFVDLDADSRKLVRWSVEYRTRELRKFLHLDAVEAGPAGCRSDLEEMRMELEVALDKAPESSVLAELRTEVDVALKEVLEGPRNPGAERRAQAAAELRGRHAYAGCASTSERAIRVGRRARRAFSAIPLVPLVILCIYLLSPSLEPAEATPPAVAPASVTASLPAASLVLEPIDAPREESLPAASQMLQPIAAQLEKAPLSLESELEQLTLEWAEAWSQQRARTYLELYAPAFRPPDALSRAAWEAQREERILKPRSIQVEVSDLETEILSADHARVRFAQTYRSDRFHDQVRKTLELVRGEQGWQILAERTG